MLSEPDREIECIRVAHLNAGQSHRESLHARVEHSRGKTGRCEAWPLRDCDGRLVIFAADAVPVTVKVEVVRANDFDAACVQGAVSAASGAVVVRCVRVETGTPV